MAFGRHWEWRGFGNLEGSLRSAIESLALKFPNHQEVTDQYLWAPGCDFNLKLRFSNFKIKRLIQKHAEGIEEWLEDEEENYEFPLAPGVVAQAARALRIGLPERFEEPVEESADLVRIFRANAPLFRLIQVKKKRWLHLAPDIGGVLVERVEIYEPENVASVAVESPDPNALLEVMRTLGLPASLKTMNYLKALKIWNGGGRVLGGVLCDGDCEADKHIGDQGAVENR